MNCRLKSARHAGWIKRLNSDLSGSLPSLRYTPVDEITKKGGSALRAKPICVRQIAASGLENPLHCGYLEKRHHSGAWVRYWCVLCDDNLYCYLSPSDMVTSDVIGLNVFQLLSYATKYCNREYVLELNHERFMPMYFSAPTPEEFSKWGNLVRSSTSPIHCATSSPIEHRPNQPRDSGIGQCGGDTSSQSGESLSHSENSPINDESGISFDGVSGCNALSDSDDETTRSEGRYTLSGNVSFESGDSSFRYGGSPLSHEGASRTRRESPPLLAPKTRRSLTPGPIMRTAHSPSPTMRSARSESDIARNATDSKQKLLDVLEKLKEDIEASKRRTRIQKSIEDNTTSRVNREDGSEMPDETKYVQYMTRLQQKRMSTQIKVDKLHKELFTPPPKSKKRSLFRLAGKKKRKLKTQNSDEIEVQMKALTNDLVNVEKDIAEIEKQRLAFREQHIQQREVLNTSPFKSLLERRGRHSLERSLEKEKADSPMQQRTNPQHRSLREKITAKFRHPSPTKQVNNADINNISTRMSLNQKWKNSVPQHAIGHHFSLKESNSHWRNWSLGSDSSSAGRPQRSVSVHAITQTTVKQSVEWRGRFSRKRLSENGSLSSSSTSGDSVLMLAEIPRVPIVQTTQTFQYNTSTLPNKKVSDAGSVTHERKYISKNGNVPLNRRKKVDPKVLAEIEAFEEFSRTVLAKKDSK